MKARVFLSYARNDGADACNFFLKSLQYAGCDVWRDVEKLAGGDPWQEKIEAAIRHVDVVLLIYTPEAKMSANVTAEWKTALRFGKRIAVLVRSFETTDRLETLVPVELQSGNLRDVRGQAEYQLEPARVQKDLGDKRAELQAEFDRLRAEIAGRIESSRQKYIEPLADQLSRMLAAEPVGLPPEVILVLFHLMQKLVDDLSADRDIASLVESMWTGLYAPDGWKGEPVYRLWIDNIAQILKRVRDAIPVTLVPVVVVAMTAIEAEELAKGDAFTGLPLEWLKEFEIIRPRLAASWQQHYTATSNGWTPFFEEGAATQLSIQQLIAQEFQRASDACGQTLRPSYEDIRTLPLEKSRKQLLNLRKSGCIVVMDAVSAWHPQLHASFRASSLDVLSNSLVVRVSAFETLDSVRKTVGFLLREWLNCEFFQRADIDLDDSCHTVRESPDLRKWVRNRLKERAEILSTQQSGLRQHTNRFGTGE